MVVGLPGGGERHGALPSRSPLPCGHGSPLLDKPGPPPPAPSAVVIGPCPIALRPWGAALQGAHLCFLSPSFFALQSFTCPLQYVEVGTPAPPRPVKGSLVPVHTVKSCSPQKTYTWRDTHCQPPPPSTGGVFPHGGHRSRSKGVGPAPVTRARRGQSTRRRARSRAKRGGKTKEGVGGREGRLEHRRQSLPTASRGGGPTGGAPPRPR